jgi:medium-chain acyl-[acyl-carrier-protein] hydrolase
MSQSICAGNAFVTESSNVMRRSLLLLKSSQRAAVRIVCFPYGGGSAQFVRDWPQHLPAHMELFGVQYPGRDSRFSEPLLLTAQAIVDDLFEDVARYTDLPLVLFGYSLGALIAYETSKKLVRHGLGAPAELVVAASRAPHLARKNPRLSTLPDVEFIAKLRKFGGTPESVLQDEEVMRHYLPILRADFAAAENYRSSEPTPLPCPITALLGSSDEMVDESVVEPWQVHTLSAFAMHPMEGGHFFLNKRLNTVISIVRQLAEAHADYGLVKRTRSS